jgi:GTP-binding protein EngB required for normal cell division
VLSNCGKSSFMNKCFGTKQYSITTVSRDGSNTDLSNAEDSETSAEDEPLATCIAL